MQQQSSLYQLAQKQLAEAGQQLEARSKALAALQHEKDELLRHFEAKQAKDEVWAASRGSVGCVSACSTVERSICDGVGYPSRASSQHGCAAANGICSIVWQSRGSEAVSLTAVVQ